jgi:hypothetical protein
MTLRLEGLVEDQVGSKDVSASMLPAARALLQTLDGAPLFRVFCLASVVDLLHLRLQIKEKEKVRKIRMANRTIHVAKGISHIHHPGILTQIGDGVIEI